jgi:hypothetical protein
MPKKVRLLHEGIVKVSQRASGFVTFPMCPLNSRNGPRCSGKKKAVRGWPRRKSVFRLNIAFATVSKPFPALSGTIQGVLVL